MAFFITALLNGLSYGLLLFMLSAGFTLIFSMMGVLNFAHASFYMLGAYLGYAFSQQIGFWPALLLAPVLVGVSGMLFEHLSLRKVHASGHVPELLVTFGLSYLVLELVQLVWGRSELAFELPELLRAPALTLVQPANEALALVWGTAAPGVCSAAGVVCALFPASRAFMMGVALSMLLVLWWLLSRTRTGLVIRAALTHPHMVQSLGHNLPRVYRLVFGVGTGLAGLAGVIGGSTFVTGPHMAASLGSIIFVVVVVGGLGSLTGAFVASVLIGLIQTLAVTFNLSVFQLALSFGLPLGEALREHPVLRLSLSQVAPILPYLLLVLVLVWRPKGLLGTLEA
jgi:branched-chain amino acid transport system permease protein